MITIERIIEKIIGHIPGGKIEGTVDTVKCGDPKALATGITVTFTATPEVLRQAVRQGDNMIIVHEPLFYNHRDNTEGLEGDAVFEAKRKYLAEHGLTVWRFHDYSHYPKPDLIQSGMAASWGWTPYLDPARKAMAVIPPTRLEDLVAELKGKLGAECLRYVGEPDTICRNVGLLLGAVGAEMQLSFLARPDVDTVICGETSEWQTCEYVRDAKTAGTPKALIVLGHAWSEEAGMRDLAAWIGQLVPETPVRYAASGDPYRWL